ncbi:RdgB/HAM1 family non-canonical purine NTP pyrophosphatase [Candidatus Binatia bacterium]|nr:RdgB/HAM1 family non-canonical purine NTP pyrophosphatase [Candidatus Binatia bacterium]
MAKPILVIATTNPGKLGEFADLLGDLPISLRSLADCAGVPEVEEDGATYVANATKKALTVVRWTGYAALADDSGLEVDALGGAPGVRSARYGGPGTGAEANAARLLADLSGVPPERRTARFRCVIVVARPDGGTRVAEGVCEGRITETPRGSGGFGYDPVFFDPELGCTFAEAAPEAKQARSHRARACAALRPPLIAFLAGGTEP